MIIIGKLDPRRLLGVRIAVDNPHRRANHPAAGKADKMPLALARHGAKIGEKEGTKPDPDARLRAATRHGAKIGQKGGVKTTRV
jgi:hypothetical protein